MKHRGFRMFPERLPQSWSAVSYGARGFAYDWWRTYEDELVTVPLHAICASLGVPPRSRRFAAEWLRELIDIGAIKQHANGLQMSAIIRRKPRQDDAESTLSERSDDAQTTLSEPSSHPQATLSERSSGAKYAESIGAGSPFESGYTERETERARNSNVMVPMGDRAASALVKLQAGPGPGGLVSSELQPSRTNWPARSRDDRLVDAFDLVTGSRRSC